MHLYFLCNIRQSLDCKSDSSVLVRSGSMVFSCHKFSVHLPTDVTDAVVDAVSIIGEYLNEEHWLQLLCDHLKYGFWEYLLYIPCSYMKNHGWVGMRFFKMAYWLK